MLEATAYVAAHPGCSKMDPAWKISPGAEYGNQRGLRYGYRSVDRAIHAGLISGNRLARRWELFVTDKGMKELNALSKVPNGLEMRS